MVWRRGRRCVPVVFRPPGLLLHQHFGPREEVEGQCARWKNFHFDNEIDLVGSEGF